MNDLLHEDETIEDLQLNNLMLLQKKKGFRYGMDSVLLSEFACIGENDHVAEFGTGSGVIPLLLIGRGKGKDFYCIEIQEEIADMARRSVQLNRLENRITIVCDDVTKSKDKMPPCQFDCVICNPPYGITGKVLESPDQNKAVSRSHRTDELHLFFKNAHYLLKGKGKMILVYPASQMLFVMEKLQECHLEPKKFQLVYPYRNKAANLVLIEAVKDAKPTLHPCPPMIIYESNGELTNELKSVYHINENSV